MARPQEATFEPDQHRRGHGEAERHQEDRRKAGERRLGHGEAEAPDAGDEDGDQNVASLHRAPPFRRRSKPPGAP